MKLQVLFSLKNNGKIFMNVALKVGSCPNNDKSVQFSFLSFSL